MKRGADELIDQNPVGKKIKTLNKALFAAAKNGKTAEVITLLKEGADINFISLNDNDKERSILMIACVYGHTETAKALVAYDARIINNLNNENESALLIASFYGRDKIVELLLENGANLAQEDIDGWTAFMVACQNGHLTTVAALVAHEPNLINEVNQENDSGLTIASNCGHTSVVKFLLEKGANAKHKDHKGWNSLMFASEKGDLKTAAVLIAHDSSLINEVNQVNTPALILASSHGHTALVKLLLANGANAKHKNNKGMTALMYTCTDADINTAAVLLAHDDSLIHDVNQNNDSTLILAADNGQAGMVSFLLEKGANAKHKGNQGWTALMYACQNADNKKVEVLLAHDASLINETALGGACGLLIASNLGHSSTVKFLLAKGANAKHKDNNEWTSLMYACQEGHTETVKVLVAHEPSLTNELNQDKGSALSIASYHGHTSIVAFLLENGANAKHQDNVGGTALICACLQGHKEIVKIILEYEPTVLEIKNSSGNTALNNAIAHPEIIILLLSQGFNDHDELKKALKKAIKGNHHRVVALINGALWLRTFIDDILEAYKLKLPFEKQSQLTDFGILVAKDALFKHLYLFINVLKDCYSNERQKRELTNRLVEERLLNKNGPLSSKSFDGFMMQNHKPFLLGMIAANSADFVPMDVIKQILMDLSKDPRAGAAGYIVGFNLAKQRQKNETKKTHWLQDAGEYIGLKRIAKAFGA